MADLLTFFRFAAEDLWKGTIFSQCSLLLWLC